MTIEEFDNFYSNIKNSKVLNINSRYACLITDDDIDSIDWIVNDAAKASRSKHLNVYVHDIATDTKVKAQCILTNNNDLVDNQKYSIALFIDNKLVNSTLITYGVAE